MHDLGVPPFAEPSNGAKQRIQSCVVICSDYFPAIESSAKGINNAKQLDQIPAPHAILVHKKNIGNPGCEPCNALRHIRQDHLGLG